MSFCSQSFFATPVITLRCHWSFASQSLRYAVIGHWLRVIRSLRFAVIGHFASRH